MTKDRFRQAFVFIDRPSFYLGDDITISLLDDVPMTIVMLVSEGSVREARYILPIILYDSDRVFIYLSVTIFASSVSSSPS